MSNNTLNPQTNASIASIVIVAHGGEKALAGRIGQLVEVDRLFAAGARVARKREVPRQRRRQHLHHAAAADARASAGRPLILAIGPDRESQMGGHPWPHFSWTGWTGAT